MQNFRTLFLASAIAAIAAHPAWADWHRLGRVSFGTGMRTEVVRGPEAPVRRLRFTARNNPLICDSIRAHLENGRRITVYSGRLPQGRTVRASLPGRGPLEIRRLIFRCRATHNTAFVETNADTTDRFRRPRESDRRGFLPPRRDFGRNGGVVQPEQWALWRQLGSAGFRADGDREVVRAGRRGRRVTALALRPVNADARCSRVIAQFFNGSRRQLNIRRYPTMQRGLFYVLDIPGDAATVVRLEMRCQPVRDRRVRIEVYAKRRGD